MHDIDRTLTEYESESALDELEDPESAFGLSDGESAYDGEGPESGILSDEEEMEAASDLLSVTSEAEMDQFLGKLFRKATRGIGRFMKSGVGRTIGRTLKGLAKKALPVVGGALGSIVAPGLGTAVGGALGRAAGNLFDLELEGLSPEDAEFEVARRVVRFGAAAARNAARMANSPAPAVAIARRALTAAARNHAPGLLQAPAGGAPNGAPAAPCSCGRAREGRWVRRGNRIIVIGV